MIEYRRGPNSQRNEDGSVLHSLTSVVGVYVEYTVLIRISSREYDNILIEYVDCIEVESLAVCSHLIWVLRQVRLTVQLQHLVLADCIDGGPAHGAAPVVPATLREPH